MNSLKVVPNTSLAVKSARVLHDFIYENYPEGGKLPGENELASLLGVTRATISQAMKILEGMGLVYRMRGSGTYVNKLVLRLQYQSKMQVRLDTHFEVLQLIEKSGHQARIELQEVTLQDPTEETRSVFNTNGDGRIVTVKKFVCMDDKAVIHFQEKIPVDLFKVPTDKVDFNKNVFEVLEEYCNCRILYGMSEILPYSCEEDMAKKFGIQPLSNLIKLKSLYFMANNQPILQGVTVYNTNAISLNVFRRRDL